MQMVPACPKSWIAAESANVRAKNEAAAVALLPGFDDPQDDTSVDCVPAALVFGRLPMMSVPANLLAVPVAGAVMLYGLPAGLLAGAVPPLAPGSWLVPASLDSVGDVRLSACHECTKRCVVSILGLENDVDTFFTGRVFGHHVPKIG